MAIGVNCQFWPSYWSQHQAKPIGKHQAGTPKIMEPLAEVPIE